MLLCFVCLRLVIVVSFFLAMPLVCLKFVIVVIPDHTHYFWNVLSVVLEHNKKYKRV